MKTNKEVFTNILEKIGEIKNHIENVQNAVNACRHPYDRDADNLGDALICQLRMKELNLWHDLMGWGLTLDEEDQQKVRCIVYERMRATSYHLNETSYKFEDDIEALAAKHFAPKHIKDEWKAQIVSEMLHEDENKSKK